MCSDATTFTDVLTLAVDNYYELYFDGVLVVNSTLSYDWHKPKKIQLPTSTSVIAIAGYNKVEKFTVNPAGIIASDSKGQIWTNSSWRCSNVSVEGWMGVGFNDSDWPYAAELAFNGGEVWTYIPGISTNAKWIWTSKFDATTGSPLDVSIYCRLCIGTFDYNYILKRLSL